VLLKNVEVLEGEQPGRVRLVGRIRYESDGLEELIWFDFPDSLRSQVSSSGNPWLVLLLPLSVSLGERLRLDIPVDPALLESCHQLLDVWHAWYPDRQPVPIEAPTARPDSLGPRDGTGLFFSGGVDSFHSLIRRNGPAAAEYPVRVTDLLLLHGADIPLTDADAFDRLRSHIAEVAREFGTRLVDIASNARDTRWGRADWPHLSHAALLTAAGLALEERFARLLIASSANYGRLQPYGSHPITDPMFSTSATRVIHDSAHLDRPDKIFAIAEHPAVLKHLRVCWLGKSDVNCGRCPKCFHTMVGLEMAGTLSRSESFPRQIDPAVFRHLYFERQGTYTAYWMVRTWRQRAVVAGRTDLVRLLDSLLTRSDRLGLARDIVDGLARRGLISTGLRQKLLARLFSSSIKY
jgi:hypothetical protein